VKRSVLVTGGVGFLGSHLCDRLWADGHVLCVDKFATGSKRNVTHRREHERFQLLRHDVTFPLFCRSGCNLQPSLPCFAHCKSNSIAQATI
jgi:UDP-glucuronate decarboxylase